jgi:selenocysteine lyase/cysteine desulfurase
MKSIAPDFIAPLSKPLTRRQALGLGGLSLGGLSAATLAQTSQQTSATTSRTQLAVPSADEQWNILRGQLMLNPRWAYFDTATAGSATRAVLAAEYRALEALHTDEHEFYAARYNAQAVQQLCSHIASWMNCSRDELTLTRGAQAGLEQFAHGFTFQPTLQSGDELVLCNQLPATMITFWTQWARQRGLTIKMVMLPTPLLNETPVVESFSAALGQRSRLMVFSHVQHTDGAILPVRELSRMARERKVMSVVDGTLSLGAMTVSITDMECDVYASSLCRWLNGPQHAGVLFVRRELHAQLPYLSDAMIEMLDLNTASWPSLIAKLPQDFLHFASQFQALPAALSLQENLGKSLIAARIHELSSYARLQLQTANLQVLTPVPGQMWSNILAVSAGRRNVAELINYLRRTDQVIVGGMNLPTGAALRMSFHIYNSFDDIDRLLRGLIRTMKN